MAKIVLEIEIPDEVAADYLKNSQDYYGDETIDLPNMVCNDVRTMFCEAVANNLSEDTEFDEEDGISVVLKS